MDATKVSQSTLDIALDVINKYQIEKGLIPFTQEDTERIRVTTKKRISELPNQNEVIAYSLQDLAPLLGVHYSTLYRHWRAGNLVGAYRIGSRILVPASIVEAMKAGGYLASVKEQFGE